MDKCKHDIDVCGKLAEKGANFTPALGHYSGVKPFRAWVQMVLPQVYNDALSYQELVYKLLWYINTLLEDVNTCEEDIAKLREAFNQLQCYVNMYFYNLDLKEVIDAKLDAMAASGELTTTLMKYIEAGSGIELEVTTETKTKEIPIPCYCKVCPLDKSCCPSCKWYDKETGEFSRTQTVEYEVSKMNIHTDLDGGTGITISPESSTTAGTQTISMNVNSDGNSGVDVDVNDDGSVSYSLNLTDGDGIKTSKLNDGSVKIDALVKSGTGTKVSVDSDNYYKVDLDLGEGSGVDVDTSDGSVKIGLNLKAKDGIELKEEDDGTTSIKSLIKAGSGVLIKLDDDNFYEISTADTANLDNTLVQGEDFEISIGGIIYPVAGSQEATYRTYANYTGVVEDDVHIPTFKGTIAKDLDGNITAITISIASCSYVAGGNIADESLFMFRHGSSVQSVPCILLDFYFKGEYADLSDPSSNVQVVNPTVATWNVRAVNRDPSIELTEDNVSSVYPFGASWSVQCTLSNYTDDDGIKHYCLAAHSIADGYNGQYSRYGDYVYGTFLNVNRCTLSLTY